MNVDTKKIFYLLTHVFIAKLSPAQSNINSVGWVELALIPTFTHPNPTPPTPRESTIQLLAKFKI